MAEEMTLLTLAHTGHVLAACSREGAGGELDAAAIAGAALPVRGSRLGGSTDPQLVVTIPPTLLEVKTTPYDAAVLASPQDYIVNGGAPVKVAGMSASNGLTFDANQAEVPTAIADVPVALVLESVDKTLGERRIQAGKSALQPDGTTIAASLAYTLLPKIGEADARVAAIPSGHDWAVLIAVGGEQLAIEKHSI